MTQKSAPVLDSSVPAGTLETRLVESLYDMLYGQDTTDPMLLERVAELDA